MIWVIILIGVELLIPFVYGFKATKQRYWNMLIALDQLGNTYGGGHPEETISRRAARQSHKKGWKLLGRILDKIDPGHMQKALGDGGGSAWQ